MAGTTGLYLLQSINENCKVIQRSHKQGVRTTATLQLWAMGDDDDDDEILLHASRKQPKAEGKACG